MTPKKRGPRFRELKAEVATLREQVTRLDAVVTADYCERLRRVEERLEALERRSA